MRVWSRRQKAMSLWSWGSGLYAAVTTGVEALGLRSGLRDFGNNTRVTIACDQPRGGGPHSTLRLGLAKHVHTRHLWLQAARDEGRSGVVKIPTERNPADPLTEPLPFDHIQDLCKLVGVEHDQDSKTPEVQCPSTRSPRTNGSRCVSKYVRLSRLCNMKSPVVSRRAAMLLVSHNVTVVSCAQRPLSAGIVRVAIGAAVDVLRWTIASPFC